MLLVLGLWEAPSQSAFAQTNAASARRFDEFGDAQLSDIAARLDNFAIALQNQPEMRGFVIAYRARRDLPGLSSRLVSWLKDYLVETRGISAARVVAVDGGVSWGGVIQELWLVPAGAAPAPRSDAYATVFVDSESARKFDEGPYYPGSDYPESYYHDVSQSLEGFSEALRREPKAFGYLIGYSAYRTDKWEEVNERGITKVHRSVIFDSPKTAGNKLTEEKATLVKKYGIRASRIKLINGGYRKWRGVELWIVPRGVYPPIPTPNAFPKRRR